jgi:hypothetical protein
MEGLLVAISEETKKGLGQFLEVLVAALALLPYTGCALAGSVVKQWVTPEMVAAAAEQVGIREIIIVRGEPGSTFTGIIDQRTNV